MKKVYLVQTSCGDVLFCADNYDVAKKMLYFYTSRTSASVFLNTMICQSDCPSWLDRVLIGLDK